MPIAITEDGPELPDDIVTATAAIVGQRGSGKTHTGSVLAEGMYPLHVPLVVIDPTGVWWGLRVGAAGEGAGIPIAIVGGRHGDVPLRPDTGDLVGQLVADSSLSCIIDVSGSKQAQWRPFLRDFFQALYQHNRSPLHLIIDEADVVVPQRTGRGASLELHDIVDDIVRRGRVKGIGSTLITQRPAVVSKNVLSQIEMLIVMHLTAPQDHKAIEAWVDAHDTANRKRQVLDSLATLKPGDAWVWAPRLGLFDRVRIRPRRTFDSSSTPRIGEKRKIARSFADIDASRLQQLLEGNGSVAQEAETPKATDTVMSRQDEAEARALRQHIQRLEKKLAVSVPRTTLEACRREIQRLREETDTRLDALEGLCAEALKDQPTKAPEKREFGRPPRARPEDSPGGGDGAALEPSVRLRPAEQRVLDGVRWWDAIGIDSPTRVQVAWVAGYSPKSSAYHNNVSRLHKLDLVAYGGRPDSTLSLTPIGRAASNAPRTPGSEEELHEHVRDKLRPAHRKILDVLLDLRGSSISREDLAGRLEKSVKSSSFHNDISALKTAGVLEYPAKGMVSAAMYLFLDD